MTQPSSTDTRADTLDLDALRAHADEAVAMLKVLGKYPAFLHSFAPMPYLPLNKGGAGDRSVFMSPEEAAEVVVWLAGDNFGVLSGSQVAIDRGVMKY